MRPFQLYQSGQGTTNLLQYYLGTQSGVGVQANRREALGSKWRQMRYLSGESALAALLQVLEVGPN